MKKITVLILFLAACSSDANNEDNNGDNNGIVIDFDLGNSPDSTQDSSTTPDQGGDATTTPGVATIIGDGDGSVGSVTFTEILAA